MDIETISPELRPIYEAAVLRCYRAIDYELRRLRTSAFNDDTKEMRTEQSEYIAERIEMFTKVPREQRWGRKPMSIQEWSLTKQISACEYAMKRKPTPFLEAKLKRLLALRQACPPSDKERRTSESIKRWHEGRNAY